MEETIGSILALAIMLGLAWLVFRWVRLRAGLAPTAPALRGPHGWLALFIFGSYIVAPLLTFGNLANDFQTVERQYPNLLTLPSWSNYKMGNWLLFGGAAMWQWWVAYGLHKNFVPSSVKAAKLFLLFNPVLLSVGILVLSYTALNYVLVEAAFTVLLKGLAGGIAWYLYFKFSRRVKNTYFTDIGPIGSGRGVPEPDVAAGREDPTFSAPTPLASTAPLAERPAARPQPADELAMQAATPRAEPQPDSSAYSNTLTVQLDALKRMHERGALTDNEYEQKRRELLARI